jgi:hypothetical protein
MTGDNRSVTARDITGRSVVPGDHNAFSTTMLQQPPPCAHRLPICAFRIARSSITHWKMRK